MSNIEKIKSMINRVHTPKVQTGYKQKSITQRSEGEIWEERGKKWTLKEGKRQQITKVPGRGWDKCTGCDKLILKKRDQDTFNRMNRCYSCQINFEVDLKATGKWKDWVIQQEEQRWKTIDGELKQILKEMSQEDSPFDKTVANAISNENMKKNKRNAS